MSVSVSVGDSDLSGPPQQWWLTNLSISVAQTDWLIGAATTTTAMPNHASSEMIVKRRRTAAIKRTLQHHASSANWSHRQTQTLKTSPHLRPVVAELEKLNELSVSSSSSSFIRPVNKNKYRVGQKKTGPFLRVYKFATVGARNACDMS